MPSENSIVSEFTVNVELTHSERLLWAIHQTLQSARWTLKDVDLFGVGVGPGSFTGIRVGLTTARTFAHVLGKPLVGVSSLEVLARPTALIYSKLDKPVLVVAAREACKGELFALWGFAHSWKARVEEQVITPGALIDALKRELEAIGPTASWIVVGDGRRRYLEYWKKLAGFNELDVRELLPESVSGYHLGQLVWQSYETGKAQEGLTLSPRYLRQSDAELKLKAGLLKMR